MLCSALAPTLSVPALNATANSDVSTADDDAESSPAQYLPKKKKTLAPPDGSTMDLSNIYKKAAHQLNDFVYGS